ALILPPIDPAFSTPYQYDPSSRFIVAMLPGNKARLFDLTTRHMSHEVELQAEHDIEWARASDDGRVIAGALRSSASRAAVMQLWDAHTGEPIGAPVGYDSSLDLYTMRFSPDGRWVAVAAYGHRVRLIDTVTGEQHGQDWRHPGPVVDLIFSPDSTRLAVGARGGSVWVWNTTTLGLPVESVTRVAMSAAQPAALTAATAPKVTPEEWDPCCASGGQGPERFPIFQLSGRPSYGPSPSAPIHGGWPRPISMEPFG
ncbi:MAG: hypothetical protein ABGY41_03130, partial [Candidatus Poribacteria bacterium]